MSVLRLFQKINRRDFKFSESDTLLELHRVAVLKKEYSMSANGLLGVKEVLKSISPEEFNDLELVLPEVENNLKETIGKISPIASKRFSASLRYNVLNGKKLRGLATIHAYKAFGISTKEDIRLISILGWCIEMIASALLVQDDILDQSELRRNLPCWYKLRDVGLQAINDSLMIENATFVLLKNYLSQHNSYLPILELFHEAFLRTSIGQLLDMSSVVGDQPQFKNFTMDIYTSQAVNKCAYYSVVLPITTALYFSQRYDPDVYPKIVYILNALGLLFQVKDDFLDCFGVDLGRDIPSGKCSWLAVKTLEMATANQRDIFTQFYGKSDAPSEEKILELYNQMNLQSTYYQFEKEQINLIISGLSRISNKAFPHCIAYKLLDSFAAYK